MTETIIRRVDGEDETIGDFIHNEFTRYGIQNGVTLNYDEFCFAAENADGKIIGVITGRAYYNEVHIGDLIVAENHRGSGVGSQLVRAVEKEYRNKGYDVITLTSFGFQAPEFYKKLGYTVEFVRNNANPKLSKYFLKKAI
jgi:ribosomal protein S18 acetylase RimI-like enzyme